MNRVLKAFSVASPGEKGVPALVPLAGFYRRSDEFEARRIRFYQACERQFGERRPSSAPRRTVGRDGRRCIPVPFGTTVIDLGASPLDYLFFKGLMVDASGEDKSDAWLTAGLLYREDREMSEVSGLRAAALEWTPSASGPPRPLSDRKLDAMAAVGRLHARLGAGHSEFELAFWHDEFIWIRDGAEKTDVQQRLLQMLDLASDYYSGR